MIGGWVLREIVPALACSVPAALVVFMAIGVAAWRDRRRDDAEQASQQAGARRCGTLRTRAVVRHQQCVGVERWARRG